MNHPSELSDEQRQKIAKRFERIDARGAREKHPERRVVEAFFLPPARRLPRACSAV
jgi:hypothetical protein